MHGGQLSVSGQTHTHTFKSSYLTGKRVCRFCTGAFIQRAHILALSRAQLLALTSAFQAAKPSWDENSAIMSTIPLGCLHRVLPTGLGGPLNGHFGLMCLIVLESRAQYMRAKPHGGSWFPFLGQQIAEWLWLCIAGLLTVRSRGCSSGGGRSTSRSALLRAATREEEGPLSLIPPVYIVWALWPWLKPF